MGKLIIALTLLPTLTFADRLIPTQDFMVEIHTDIHGDPYHLELIQPGKQTREFAVGQTEKFAHDVILELYEDDKARMLKVTPDSVYFYSAKTELHSARTVKDTLSTYTKTGK